MSFSKEQFTGGGPNSRNDQLSYFIRGVHGVTRRVLYVAYFQSAVPYMTPWPLVPRLPHHEVAQTLEYAGKFLATLMLGM